MFTSKFHSGRSFLGKAEFFAAMKAGVFEAGTAPLRRISTLLLPALALLVLASAANAGLLWLSPVDSARAQAGQTVAADWALVPDGIEPGDSFRLLFVTSTTKDAASFDIADYNSHVRSAAGGNASLADFSNQFTALISTATVDARDNTGTTGAGVPIHWLGGEKVADDYADLYDGTWDSVSGKTEGGGGYTGLVWTGGNKAGQKSGQRHAGASEVRMGDLGDEGLALSSPEAKPSSEAYPFYAISPVLTVTELEPAPAITAGPTIHRQPDQRRYLRQGRGHLGGRDLQRSGDRHRPALRTSGRRRTRPAGQVFLLGRCNVDLHLHGQGQRPRRRRSEHLRERAGTERRNHRGR